MSALRSLLTSAMATAAHVSAALDTAFRQHLNLMLRPHLAQRLRAAAASLPAAQADGQPGGAQMSAGGSAGRRSTFALPFLGESLMAAMDMTGRSPARSSPGGGALSGSLTQAGSALLPGSARSNSVSGREAAFAAGSPNLLPFTGFDEGLEGADDSLEDGADVGNGSTPHDQLGADGFGAELQPFTAFDPGLPGADMALDDAASGALDGALEADAAAMTGEEAQEDTVETADDWGVRPFGIFGVAEEEDLSLEEMAAPAANGTSSRLACSHSSHSFRGQIFLQASAPDLCDGCALSAISQMLSPAQHQSEFHSFAADSPCA